MEEDYVPAAPLPVKKRHYEGDYVNIPANLPHCYEEDISGRSGVGEPIPDIPAMNAEILEIQMMPHGTSGLNRGYIVIQDEDERQIVVLITDELLAANESL